MVVMNIKASLVTLYVRHVLCPSISSSLQPTKEGIVIWFSRKSSPKCHPASKRWTCDSIDRPCVAKGLGIIVGEPPQQAVQTGIPTPAISADT